MLCRLLSHIRGATPFRLLSSLRTVPGAILLNRHALDYGRFATMKGMGDPLSEKKFNLREDDI
jgi:hypothetical protein